MTDDLVELLQKYKTKLNEYTVLKNDKKNYEINKEKIDNLYSEMESIKKDLDLEVKGLNGAGT